MNGLYSQVKTCFLNPKPQRLRVGGCDESGVLKKDQLVPTLIEDAVLRQDPLAIKALILLTTHNPDEYGEWKACADALREVYDG